MNIGLILLLVSAVAENAQPQKFGGLEQLVGHCWQAPFPDGKKVDTHCFSSVYGGAFIKDEHVVCGDGKPYYGETWYVHDAKTDNVTYRYYNSLGGVSDGSVQTKDNQLVFPDETYENNGQKIVYRTRWTLNEDEYLSQMWQQDETQESGWKAIWQMNFKKVDLNKQSIAELDKQGDLICKTAKN